jgi:RNA polymerase sigma factor (TIGR02999 family)
MSELDRILSAIERGDTQAAEQLLPLVYDELRRMAAHRLSREKPGQTLQATALVHEAYLRLMKPDQDQRWDGRGHFFAAASEAMRRILIENARRKRAEKHGGGKQREELDESGITAPDEADELLALDGALEKLAATDPLAVRLVKLRYYAGLTIPQAAAILEVSPRTADRLWAYARAWLHQEIQGGPPET